MWDFLSVYILSYFLAFSLCFLGLGICSLFTGLPLHIHYISALAIVFRKAAPVPEEDEPLTCSSSLPALPPTTLAPPHGNARAAFVRPSDWELQGAADVAASLARVT